MPSTSPQVERDTFLRQAQESHHLIVIIKGLATAHEHHVSHLAPFAQKAVGQKHLGEHLTR